MSCRNAARGGWRPDHGELTGPDHGNSLVLENYHAARSHGPSDYIYDLLQVVFAGHYPFAVDTPT